MPRRRPVRRNPSLPFDPAPVLWILGGTAAAYFLLSSLGGDAQADDLGLGIPGPDGAQPFPLYTGDDPYDGVIGVRPTGQRYEAVHAPLFANSRAGHCEYVRAMVAALGNLGLLSGRPALLYTAHTARENAYGTSLYNNNVGNVKAYGEAPWYAHPVQHRAYVSYPTFEAGVAVNVGIIRDRSRYAGPWAKLQAGDDSWYGDLGRAGYYENSGESYESHQQEYSSIFVPYVTRCAGA